VPAEPGVMLEGGWNQASIMIFTIGAATVPPNPPEFSPKATITRLGLPAGA